MSTYTDIYQVYFMSIVFFYLIFFYINRACKEHNYEITDAKSSHFKQRKMLQALINQQNLQITNILFSTSAYLWVHCEELSHLLDVCNMFQFLKQLCCGNLVPQMHSKPLLKTQVCGSQLWNTGNKNFSC